MVDIKYRDKIKLIDYYDYFASFIRDLRNNNRKQFVKQHTIGVDEHLEFMKLHGDNYKICLIDDTPVGFIGCVDGDLRLAVNEIYRGKGIGTWMIRESHKYWPKATAKVKRENVGSILAFERAGLKRAQTYIVMEWE